MTKKRVAGVLSPRGTYFLKQHTCTVYISIKWNKKEGGWGVNNAMQGIWCGFFSGVCSSRLISNWNNTNPVANGMWLLKQIQQTPQVTVLPDGFFMEGAKAIIFFFPPHFFFFFFAYCAKKWHNNYEDIL